MAKIKILPAFSLEAGQEPVRDVVSRGALNLRPWQVEGLAALRADALRILIAPTGSGKSTLIKALSALDLAADPQRKAVIAVPQGIIAGSFGAALISVDGNPIAWSADRLLIDTSKSIAKLEAFLYAPAASDLAGRIVVCTHQSLVLAHQRMMKGRKGKKSPWDDVALFIDEAHHSRAAVAGDDDGEADTVESNRLGAVVAHYLAARPGPLLLTTATWMRAQLDDIIPKGHEDTFTRYTHTLEADLRSKQYLKNVSFRFLIGPAEDCLRAIYGEGNKKTIAYLPHVGSAEAKAAGSKFALLASYVDAIGERVSTDDWTETRRHVPAQGFPFDVRSLDFVTEAGRNERRTWLADGIAGGGNVRTPSILWALNLGKEGFDWPELERAIVIGARGSIPEVVQMMGRVMRDHPGKPRAEFNVVLPHNGDAMDPTQVRDYMKMILASMVVEWPFKLPNLNFRSKAADKREGASNSLAEGLEDPREAVRAIDATIDRALQSGVSESDESVINSAMKWLYPHADQSDRDDAGAVISQMFSARSRLMMSNAADLPFDVEVTDGALGCVRTLAMQIGHLTLESLRESLASKSTVTATLEHVRAFAKDKTCKQYDQARELGMPGSGEFPRCYGMTFKEAMTGSPGNTAVTATIEEVRALAKGMTCKQYNASRLPGMPDSSAFQRYYGMTFKEAITGSRQAGERTATLDDVRAFAKGMTGKQYNAARLAGMPISYYFPHCYGLTFREATTGLRCESYADIDAAVEQARIFARDMTQKQYDAARLPGMPSSTHIAKKCGMTFKEAMTGSRGVTASTATLEEVRAFAGGMTGRQYDEARLPGMPSSVRFPACYAMTFTEAVTGIRGTSNVTATLEEVQLFAKGMTQKQYDAARIPGMPSASSFKRHYCVTFRCVARGVRRDPCVKVTATLDEVRVFAGGMTGRQYDASKLPGMPVSSAFPKTYGVTFGEAMNGISQNKTTATLDDVRAFAKGKTRERYEAEKPRGMPWASTFVMHYGLTFGQVRDGVTAPASDMAAE